MPRIGINITSGKLKEQDVIVGIDLGTTNSLIARMEDGQPVCIADFDKPVIVPSLLYFGPNGEVVVGEQAQPHLLTEPENTLYSIKRLMGKGLEDVQAEAARYGYQLAPTQPGEPVRVQVRGKEYTAVELSAHILRELRHRAQHRTKTEVRQAVITVPAYFNDTQRQATREAGQLAGLEVLRIVNEPTAAALAYGLGLDPAQEMTVCVYDLGGGTFDVTILRIHEGLFDVLSTHGDTHLGGDDFDTAIVNHWLTELGVPTQRIAEDKLLGQELRLKAETAKRTLTEATHYGGELVLEGTTHLLKLDVDTFRELAQPLLKRTLDACAQALADAELTRTDIQEVVLVGGSTRMPVVKEALTAFFGKTPKDHLNPDEVVALGAAVQADILAGNRKDLLLLDVTPLSLGIETAGGLMDVLLPRNSKVPNRVSRRYSTGVDGQVNLRIAVYQGEREKVEHNRKLAEFELKGIPAMPAGLPLVEVTFLLDADGILKVQAQEKRSGVQQEIVVKPSYGLTDAQVEQMLLESLKHAETDVAERMVLELREAGRQLAYTARRFTERHANLLDAREIADTLAHVRQLEAILDTADKAELQERIDALEAFTKPFAERVMNEAVKAALVGKGL